MTTKGVVVGDTWTLVSSGIAKIEVESGSGYYSYGNIPTGCDGFTIDSNDKENPLVIGDATDVYFKAYAGTTMVLVVAA